MRSASSLGVVTVFVGLMSVGSCGEGNPGIDPPADRMWFPSGLLLDPRIDSVGNGACVVDDDCAGGQLCGAGQCREKARWLFVTNANSDRRFNAGSLMAIDLDSYFDAAFGEPERVQPGGAHIEYDPEDGRGDDCDHEDTTDCCRRVANLPQVVECTEQPFVLSDATIHFGIFPGPPAAWVPPWQDEQALVLVPVAGDPSITYARLQGFTENDLRFECGQASDPDGGRMCDSKHRLRFLRNDSDSTRTGREPVRVLVSPQDEVPLAYVSHQGDSELTLIDLDGLDVYGDGDGDSDEPPAVSDLRPAIVHQARLLQAIGGIAVQGGWGLAQRPCVAGSDNVPSATPNCERPLVYAAIRWQLSLLAFTALRHGNPGDGDGDGDGDTDGQQECVNPDQLGKEGGIICDWQIDALSRIGLSGLSTAAVPLDFSRPLLADMAFSRTGNELFVVQSNPGGLIRVDTSLGIDGEPLDLDVGVVEVCSQPTSFVIYDDGSNEYGVVTCYRSGEVFIVDLAALAVVGLSRAGIGPDAMAIDIAREVVYVANSLDASISIIDMSRTSPSRFNEIGRIGLQEPYTK
jgi:hypothetical protein